MTFDLTSVAAGLIAIDSRSSVSDEPVVDYLAPLCVAAGLRVQTQSEMRDGQVQHNLLAWRDAAGGDPLLLNTHLDTVPPGDPAAWTACAGEPFALTERDGDLYGLGVADVKLDFLCKLAALERLHDADLRRPVLLAGTYGEEVGRHGARLLLSDVRPRPAMALVGEPTGLRPCTAHKGYVEIHVDAIAAPAAAASPPKAWRLSFDGVVAHSSQPDRGTSANDLLLDALPELLERGGQVSRIAGGETVNTVCPRAELLLAAAHRPRAAGAVVAPADIAAPPAPSALAAALVQVHTLTARLRRELRASTCEGFRPPYSTVNNGLLALDAAAFHHVCDVRLLPGEAPRAALERHLTALRAVAARGVEITVTAPFDAPPFATRPDSVTLAALEAALAAGGCSTAPELKSGTTEATVYAQGGVDTVVFGPGVALGNIHKPNERVPLAHLRAAVDIYATTIRHLCR